MTSKPKLERAKLPQQSLRTPHDLSLSPTSHMSLDITDHNRHVIFKLLGFTLAMIVGPIGTYFLTVDHVFKGMLLRGIQGETFMQDRQLHICGSFGGVYGQCCTGGLCHCGNDGGSE